MLSCKQAAEIVSSKDFESLPWIRRMSLKLHMKMCTCPNCKHFGEQLMMLREMARNYRKRQESECENSDKCLPPEVKTRILEELKK